MKLTVYQNSIFQLKFSEFSIPSDGHQNCEDGDSLQILVPIRGKYEVAETICGETIPKPVMSNGPKMLVEFRGRYSGKGNRGFKAEYKFVESMLSVDSLLCILNDFSYEQILVSRPDIKFLTKTVDSNSTAQKRRPVGSIHQTSQVSIHRMSSVIIFFMDDKMKE